MRTAALWFVAGAATAVLAQAVLSPLFTRAPTPVADQTALSSMPLADVGAALDSVASNTTPASAAPRGLDSAAPAAAGNARTAGTSAGPMQDAIASLEARLATKGGTDADWELLARSYEFMGRREDAVLARSHKLPPSESARTKTPTRP